MNANRVIDILCGLKTLRFFPMDENAMIAVMRLVSSMCHTEEQVQWLVDRMTGGLYDEWPGPREMRACFCSKYKPKDGQNAYSEVYPDGIPSEKENRRAIAGPQLLALAAGRIATNDEALDKAMQIAVATNSLKSDLISGPATPDEIAAAPEWLRKLEGYE